MIEIPIAAQADQELGTTINGRRVTMRVRYNVTTDRWSFTLSIDDVPVLTGRRIVLGVDLLAAFPRFGIGVMFAGDVVEGSLPDRVNLPAGNVRLYSATQAEVDAAISA
jgi:hypothetical protein